MGVTPKCLINSQYAPTSITALYTASANMTTIIDKFTVQNGDASSHTISVYLVPKSAGPGNYNLFLNAVTIASGATLDSTILQNQILNTGDSIQVVASAGNSLAVRCSGREVT